MGLLFMTFINIFLIKQKSRSTYFLIQLIVAHINQKWSPLKVLCQKTKVFTFVFLKACTIEFDLCSSKLMGINGCCLKKSQGGHLSSIVLCHASRFYISINNLGLNVIKEIIMDGVIYSMMFIKLHKDDSLTH